VTEGEDKPLKYPSIFFRSELMILSKTDLLPHVPFDADLAEQNARGVHPGMDVLRISCLTRIGMAAWTGWLEKKRASQIELKAEPVA
jgi:hydrogenase nickel incorporation protein HypB